MSPRITRRRFLLGGGVVGGCAIGTLLLFRALRDDRARSPRSGAGADWRTIPTAPLTDAELATFTATVRTLFEVKATEHYAQAFQWRAEHVPGERGVYLAFVEQAETRARTFTNTGFASADRDTRQRVLEQTVFLAHGEQASLFYSQVVTLIVAKYMTTDFWLSQGYDAWPGSPRGLESYLVAAPGDDGAPR